MNQSNRTRKLALAGLLTAVAVVGGMFSIPIGAAKCSPVQHMVNVIAGVLLGPWYGLGSAFVASLIRNLIGTGILGAMLSYPVAVLLMGKTSALFAFVPSFMINTVAGSIVAVLVLCALERTHILRTLRAGLH